MGPETGILDLEPGRPGLADRVRRLLVEVGALRQGHFLLTSGRHSDRFFLLARLFERPRAGGAVATALAWSVGEAGLGQVGAVVGPAVGGVILAYDVARALGARALYAEKEEDGSMRLRRGFRLDAGERVLVVEDALTTGGSVAKARSAVLAQGAMVVGVAAVVRRGNHALAFDDTVVSLVEDDALDWTAQACPLCRAGVDLTRPKQ